MPSRTSRWTWLTLFAVGNLACWLVAAAAVGVMASDLVDLGVESLIREKQGTIVALGEQTRQEPPTRTPNPPLPQPSAAEAVVAGEGPASVVAWPSPWTPSPAPRTEATVKAPGAASETLEATPRVPVAPTVAPLPPLPTLQSTHTSGSSPPADSEPTAIPASSPLLLADPDLEGLALMDAEIRRSAAGRPVQIRYREAALNREIAAVLAGYPELPYRNVQADLQRDQLTLTGVVTVMGLEMPTEVQGSVVARNCLPEVVIESVSIGGVLTPRIVKDQVRSIVQESLGWYPPDYPLCLEQIVLEEDRATIYGSRR